MRFRVFNVAVVGDIEKELLQISLISDDQDYVLFLWFLDAHKINFSNFLSSVFVEYQFCRVLFGVALSPFLFTGHYHIPYHSVLPFRSKIYCFIVTLIKL